MTDDQIDDLLIDLDNYARDYDGYEYGLPLFDKHMFKMRKLVRFWIILQGIEAVEGKRGKS